ncbi:hypothetical protein [Enterobacter sp. SLBN-59]|uniref:hypothetical protein n=1 Tax=Enterobacter sp. SLBN-59 TaxID=2940621 RepID=UPI0021670110|nr:hypothetical protein [Enterobacter sp. SLBN-59]MCS3490973.1 hypothetical protein [Enterobacter sp. SLBN-59]
MTTNSNGGPGKTLHLDDIAAFCGHTGMRVIIVNSAESDFRLSASLPCATAPDGKFPLSQLMLQRERGHCLFLGKPGSGMSVTTQQMRVFLAKSDVSQLRELCKGEDGEKLAEAIRQNCSVWFPLNPGGNGNDA